MCFPTCNNWTDGTPAFLALLTAVWSLLGSEERTVWRSSSLCLASCLIVDRIAARRAEAEADLAVRAACMSFGEDKGEDRATSRS